MSGDCAAHPELEHGDRRRHVAYLQSYMTFLHLWAIWIGAAAAAAPLVIHWLTRPRPVRMPLSTLRFVREAIRQRRSWHRLRDLLAAGSADAGRGDARAGRGPAAMGPAAAGLRSPGGRRRAHGAARREPEHGGHATGPSSRSSGRGPWPPRTSAIGRACAANLILAGAAPRGVFEGPRRISTPCATSCPAAGPCPQRMDVKRALDLAARMLGARPPDRTSRRRELVIVSDFQRSSWAKADFSPCPPTRDPTRIDRPGRAARPTWRSCGPRAARPARRAARGSRSKSATSPPAAGKITVDVALGNSIGGWRAPVRPAAAPRWPRRWLPRHRLAGGRGAAGGRRRRPGRRQRLPLGASSPAAADLCPAHPPGPGRRPRRAYFLECALAPTARNNRQPASTLAGGQRGSRRRLRPASSAWTPPRSTSGAAAGDLICLDHPGKLSDETIKLLAGAAASRAAGLVRGRRADRRHEPQAAGRGGRQRLADAGRVHAAAGRPGRAATCSTPRCGATSPPFARLRRQPGGVDGPAPFRRRAEFAAAGRRAWTPTCWPPTTTARPPWCCMLVRRRRAGGDQRRPGGVEPAQDLDVRALADRTGRADARPQRRPRGGLLRRAAGGPVAARGRRRPPACGSVGPGGAGAEAAARPLRRIGRRGRGAVWRWARPGPPGVYRVEPRRRTRLRPGRRHSRRGKPAWKCCRPRCSTSRLAAGRPAVYHGAPTRASAATISGSGSPWPASCASWEKSPALLSSAREDL